MPTIRVHSSRGDYRLHIAGGALATVAQHAAVRERQAIVVSTAPVFALWGERLLAGWPRKHRPTVLLHPDGEQAKSMHEFARLQSALAAAGAMRDTVLLALGGGVTGDLAGLVAATYMRGIACVQLPTTVLAQVDSSIGGKTAVDLPEGKNLVGAFYPPAAVIADTDTLATLSKREYRAGLFECIKAAILGDAQLFSLLESRADQLLARDPRTLFRVITASARLKAAIVSRDENESGPRMLLNLGHTFAHGIEAALHYRTLKHGEAVAWGILAATRASRDIGAISADDAIRIEQLILRFGPLPRFGVREGDVLAAMSRDKKHTRTASRYILVSAISRAYTSTLTQPQVRRALRSILAEAAR